MASLNLSTNGPSISKSYQTVVDSTLPSAGAGSSPTYGQWAVYSVSAPLSNAFQQDSGKESVLKVQSTGEGELVDLIDEFSDGRIQFAFAKVKDPNTTLAKSVLIAWCGEGVPERTKGYFGSYLTTVARLLHGYHVQVTARTDSDLTPEGITQKVADASGSKYSGDSAPVRSGGPPPPLASKPVFTPTQVGGIGSGFNPLSPRSRVSASKGLNVDEDGWGDDAPPVTRTQLEKVKPAYQPTKVNMADLASQKAEPSRYTSSRDEIGSERPEVVRGAYQPVGKVDIAALRKQAQTTGSAQDDRPTIVKGAYEPVGKVDIAAIRARAQAPAGGATLSPAPVSPAQTGANEEDEPPKSLVDRSAAYQSSGRISSMPKAKVANKFGSNTSTFTGTKAPTPGGFDSKPAAGVVPVGLASRTFADEGGKTPAQIWAEKKARQRGTSGAGDTALPISPAGARPLASQASGSNEWKSGYTGKSWAPVETTKTGTSEHSGISQQRTGEEPVEEEEPSSPSGNVSAIRDRFKAVPPMVGGTTAQQNDEYEAPSPPMFSKPNAGVPVPGMASNRPDEDTARMPTPPAQPRSPTPPTPDEMRSTSPIRIAQPVSRGPTEAPDERITSPPMPVKSMTIPHEDDLDDEPTGHDSARAASQAAAASTFGQKQADSAPATQSGGKRALVQFDYEKAEDNELELKEGEYVTNIDMVDEDWWMGENAQGETGLFPANYVELIDDETGHAGSAPAAAAAPAAPAAPAASRGKTATAQYDYEAAEENEISFPDGATITNLEFPDEDWWLGEYGGKSGLFPANYVQLDE